MTLLGDNPLQWGTVPCHLAEESSSPQDPPGSCEDLMEKGLYKRRLWGWGRSRSAAEAAVEVAPTSIKRFSFDTTETVKAAATSQHAVTPNWYFC